METLTITITIQFDDENSLESSFAAIDAGICEYMDSVATSNDSIVNYNVVTE